MTTNYQQVAAHLSDLGFTAAQIETILNWWRPDEHAEWLMNASRQEIEEASKPAFENENF